VDTVRFKTDKRCVICGGDLEFVEMEDVVYLLCPHCKRGIYTALWAASYFADNLPALIERLAEAYAERYGDRGGRKKGGAFS